MESDHAILVLRELLRQEQQNVAVRLQESTVFISNLSTRAQRIMGEIASASAGYCAALTSMILALGGEPGPRTGSADSADLHFMELSIALPRLVRAHETLLRYFRAAIGKLSDAPDAAALVSSIADGHQRELVALGELQARRQSEAV